MQQYDPLLKKHLHIQFRSIPTQAFSSKPEDFSDLTVVLIKDVTDSIQVERQKRQASAEIQAIFEVLPEQFIRLGLDGTILAERRSGMQKDP